VKIVGKEESGRVTGNTKEQEVDNRLM